MATAHEIAFALLDAFASNVIARREPWTYGRYAQEVGHASASHGLAIGQAMHSIGALCVIQQLPVAPLYWVRNDRGEDALDNGVFHSDPIERRNVVDSGDLEPMYVVAREHHYTAQEFDRLKDRLGAQLHEGGDLLKISAHTLWRLTFDKKPKDSPVTFYQRAMTRYHNELRELRERRAAASAS